jgi:carboxyl-terminal processing protease
MPDRLAGAFPRHRFAVSRVAQRLPRRFSARPFVLLIALLSVGAALVRPAVAQQPASDPSHLQTVAREYNLLLDVYQKPLPAPPLLDAAWQGAIKFLQDQQIAVSTPKPVLEGNRDQALAIFSKSWMALYNEAGSKADFTDVAFAADDNMANSLQDDHTGFLPPDEFAAQQGENTAGSQSIGLGIIQNSRPPHVIVEVAPGGPAEQAGLRPGDTITAINGKDVTQLSGPVYSQALPSGAPIGTPVQITVDRPGAGSMTFTVMIGPFQFPIFSSKILPGGVGYMRLRSFNLPWAVLDDGRTVVQQLDDALQSFEAAGVTTWILDLRSNFGGTNLTNQAFIGRFLPDGVVDIASDERGHQSQDLVDGHYLPVQRPLAVLVNGNSYSSSELVASALKENGRATLVGSTTGGGLGAGLLFPLPDGAGVQVTVAQVVSGQGTVIDNVGVDVDVPAPPPSAADLAAGRDPAIDAAVAALAGVQPFQAPPHDEQTLSQDELQSVLSPYKVDVSQVPPAPEINTQNYFGDSIINTYDEWNNYEGPGRDAIATRGLARQRGWQGALFQHFGEVPDGPAMVVSADLYATDAGAQAFMDSNDFPDLLQSATPPIQLGDQTVAYKGQWIDTGETIILWRHGRLVLGAILATIPGEETFDPLVQLAQAVEANYQANPIDETQLQPVP